MDEAIDVVIVAHDSGEDLARSAARALAAERVARVIVVDNGSHDGAVDELEGQRRGEPRLRIQRNPDNPGFAVACNQGARLGAAGWLAFVNPDCFLERDSLARMIDAVAGRDDIGVLGADVRDRHGEPEAAARRREPTLARSWLAALGLSRAPHVDAPRVDAVTPGTLTPVDAVSGALMLVPRARFAALGGFDEGYRLHCEDLDLCRRARDAGLVVALVEGVRVTHLKGTSSTTRRGFVAIQKHRGMWRYYRKFEGARHAWPLRTLVAAGIAVRAGLQVAAAGVRAAIGSRR